MSKEISKFLSYVLRHDPDSIGIKIDPAGWTDVATLLAKAKKAGKKFDLETLRAVVAENDKKRFTLSEDGRRIRAAQGHSIDVDLGLEPVEPPAELYHGTATHHLDSIFSQGLIPGSRRQVHLSADAETATRVGQRHGKPSVLVIDTTSMVASGHKFYRADNGVWLIDSVPPEFLSFAVLEPSESPAP